MINSVTTGHRTGSLVEHPFAMAGNRSGPIRLDKIP
jgi:hypothetical protein